MVFERNGINLIYEDPLQDGLVLKDYIQKPFDPDGGRFDYGQEEKTQQLHAHTYMGQWLAEPISEYSLKISSLSDTKLGIQSVRIFDLYPGSPCLKITQSMKNISNESTEYFFWGRTLVKPEGKLFMPVNPESIHPDKWGRYIWGEPEQFLSDSNDQGVSVKDGILSIIPLNAKNEKYGTDSHEGWMAYGYKSLLFVKKYDYFPELRYGEKYGLTSIF